ncbi:hypothetical protein [Chitinophaga pinensis]|uniref:hypothetical protein n=1 Tax=Chitinophaga pinensis TaxID=79329 RepID=UPI0021BD1E21|nr:hypothetical protein [Chitinophaga pinensis]
MREKRFQTADYVALTATDVNDAIVKVVQERRREFFCRMLPWFDQRRLKDDPLFRKTYTRTWQGTTIRWILRVTDTYSDRTILR